MTEQESKNLIRDTFESDFNRERFKRFTANLLTDFQEASILTSEQYIKDAYKPYVHSYEVIAKFIDSEKRTLDVLITYLKTESTFTARTRQRNFALDYLKSKNRDGVLIAYVHENKKDWRFSFVKLENDVVKGEDGRVKDISSFTAAKRSSFLVGSNENSYTAKKQFLPIIQKEDQPKFEDIEEAFSVETVTKEFFEKYRELFHDVHDALEAEIKGKPQLKEEFEEKEVSTVDFAKKLLGQMVFLYFLQKKGWFGVKPNEDWGTGPKNFLRELFKAKDKYGKNFFNDVLEPLFYEALAQDRGRDSIYPRLNNCRMPFLNGGLFEPMRGYSWETTDIFLPDELFSNKNKDGEDIGDGILDVFDRYNFTVNESDPLEKEVAVDPEMLGKVFENLLDVKDRKSKGSFYTPREIVHYMCQECLINYLETETKGEVPREDIENLVLNGETIIQNDFVTLEKQREKEEKGFKYSGTYELKLPESIQKNAKKIDDLLKDIKVCDPAVGSGAFPLGMINEIVGARQVLQVYLRDKLSVYDLKYHAIANSIHGVDIDPGAVDIARLRLWLSLIVEEKDPRPLPNLEHRIMQGNSLLSEYEGIQLFNRELLTKSSDEKFVQLGFVFGSGIKRKMEELERNIKIYVDTSQRSVKEKLKESIDELRWELIEETLKEQGKLDKMEEIKKLREKSVRPFFVWELEFSEVFKEKGGFDVVIGNPPYVGVKGNSEIFEPIRRGNLGRYYSGRGELFYFFFHLALLLGREKSVIAYITTNYYPTASYGSLLRKDFKEKSSIVSLINFNELKIFDSAKGQHNMITILKKTYSEDIFAETCITKRRGVADSKTLWDIMHRKDNKTAYFSVCQDELYEGPEYYIRLRGLSEDTTKVNSILNKMSNNIRLSDICYVRQGLRTGIDKTSKRHVDKYGYKGSVNQGVFVLSKQELITLGLDTIDCPLVKRLYKNSDIKRYSVLQNTPQYLLYIDKSFDELAIKEEYPQIYAHLKKYKDLIFKIRGHNSEDTKKWITLDRPREQFIFTEPKIVAPQRSYQNTFGFSEKDFYASADVYFIVQKDKKYNLKYILALVNSKLYYSWLFLKGKRKGEMLELYQQPLSEIPIKYIPMVEQEKFVFLVDEILKITSSPEFKKGDPRICDLESEIDRMVYKIFDLTEDEIKIIEEKSFDS